MTTKQSSDAMAYEPRSYWQRTAPRVVLPVDVPSTAEVAIVGGGLLGAATALWLARSGVDVVLIERAAPADGATGRNGGFVTVGPAESYPAAAARHGQATARAVYALTIENRLLLRQVLAEECVACDYREPGHLTLALGPEQQSELAHVVTALNADGFGAELLDQSEVQQLIATPLAPEVAGALFVPETGLLHSARLVQGLIAAAVRHGARVTRATVGRLERRNSGVVVYTDRGMLQSGTAVIAANAWLGQLVPELAGLITPVRGQMLAYAPLAPVFHNGLAAALTPTEEYWQQTLDGSVVLGGCRAVAPGMDVGVGSSQPTPEVQGALETVLPRLFPQLAELRVAHRWAGLMAFTPDYLPIADRLPGSSVWVVGGFCGHGMPFGLRLGQLLANGIINQQQPAELEPFSLSRPTLARREQEQPNIVSELWRSGHQAHGPA